MCFIYVTSHLDSPQTDAAYTSNLRLAALHSGQARLHLKRAQLAAPRNHRHILERLSEAEHAILVIQRLMGDVG